MKHVFVIGAGASAAACGTPLGKDLVWGYHENCSGPVPLEGGRADTREEDRVFGNYLCFLELAARYYPQFKAEPEKFRTRGYIAYSPPTEVPYVDEMLDLVQQDSDREGIELIGTLIFEHLVEVIFLERDWRQTLYDKFTEKILAPLFSEGVSVINMNYDYLLTEHMTQPVSFDYILEFDEIDTNRSRRYKRDPTVPQIKLNGSLDWGYCPTCDHLHLFFPSMDREFYDSKKCPEGCGPLKPLIVAPHERHISALEKLWFRAKEVLSQADIVTVIGYSFPNYDDEIIELFGGAFRHCAQIEVVDYSRVNEDPSVTLTRIERQYKSMFPNAKDITIKLDGFQKYVENYSAG